MANTMRTNFPAVLIPITLPQIVEGLRKLPQKDLEALEFLLDKKAMRAIRRSVEDTKRGRLREL